MPYVIRKCDSYSGGSRNDWYDVRVTNDKEDAISYVRGEMYLIFSSDPNMSSSDIDSRMSTSWGAPKPQQYLGNRYECGHGGIRYAIINSTSSKYDDWATRSRPDRTELLDSILGT